jgi:uncharacterized protein YjdB
VLDTTVGRESMRNKALLLIVSLLLGLLTPLQTSVALANEGSDQVDSIYYFIHYNGELKEIIVNENVRVVLDGWADEQRSAVKGKLITQTESIDKTEDITLSVSNQLNEIVLQGSTSFYYRVDVSDSYSVELVTPSKVQEEITVIANNENGTSAEEVKQMDEYGTVFGFQSYNYYSVNESNQKISITKEQYDSLNQKVQTSSVVEAMVAPTPPSVKYTSHVQDIGWQSSVVDGEISGTVGKGKRVEAVQISLDNAPYTGGLSYKTHVEKYGWLGLVTDGISSGTTGEAKQVEAIQVSLTGEMANYYDVYYRVHSADYGWLGWAKNGESAGTEALGKQMEAIQVILVEKGGLPPGSTDRAFINKASVVYSTHVQQYGWLAPVQDGALSGTVGEAKRLEAIKIQLSDAPYSGNISYSTHVEGYGWLSDVTNGALSGTSGEGKRMEAIKINLTGKIANYYDIYYRVHAEAYGWLGWAKNGEAAGTEGLGKRLEAIEIVLVKKGGQAPGSTSRAFVAATVEYSTHVEYYGWLNSVKNGALSGTTGQAKRLEAIKINLKDTPYSGGISYSTHVESYGWLNPVAGGMMSGTSAQGKRMEAIKIQLTGEIANYYDVYYRVHIEGTGWLSWAKNGMRAGSEGLGRRLEAIEVKLISKGKGPAASETTSFLQKKTVFLDPGHGGSDPGAVAGGYKEASLNLDVAKRVQAMLVARGYKVVMSRTGDTYLSLLDRAQMANNSKADIFISLHHNSVGTGSTGANGIESYYYQYYPDYPSKINGAMHNNPERISKSISLTSFIHNNMINYTGANNRGTAGDTFAVIRETAMPATLIELGFINNDSERRNLISPTYQDKLARAITDGIDQYFRIY